MTKKVYIFCLLAILCVSSAYTEYGETDDNLKTLVADRGQAYVEVPVNCGITMSRLSELFSISNVDEKSIELCITPQSIDSFIGLNLPYVVLSPADAKSSLMASSVEEAMMWHSYPTYDQFDSIVHLLSHSYPQLCSVDTIGTSVNGKYIFALKISDNVSADEDEAEVFYSASIHGDELGGFVIMTRLSEYLLSNYSSDERVKNLVDNLQIYIAPLTNPDGMYGNGNTIVHPTRNNTNGYDLNRNFPDVDGSSSPVIQPETACMIRYMMRHNFILSANFHSGVEVVNYPWDRWKKLHPDNDWFYNISRTYADIVHMYSQPDYMTFKDNGVTNGYQWYTTVGSRQDYVTYFLQGREVTVEIDDDKQTDAAMLEPLWIWNRSSLLGYLENALLGVKGIVRDSNSHQPIAAKIMVADHDDESSFVLSGSDGIFRRMLLPGDYTLSISADGYYDKNVDVYVSSNGLTEVSVELDVKVDGETSSLDIYPNPIVRGKYLNVGVPSQMRSRLYISVYNMMGTKLQESVAEAHQVSPLLIGTNSLKQGIYFLEIKSEEKNILGIKRFVVIEK